MEKACFEGQCKEIWSQIRVWWGIHAENDLEWASSNTEQVVGLLQQKYGCNRQRAEEEFIRQIMKIKADVENLEDHL